MSLRVAIAGCTGRMGLALLEEAAAQGVGVAAGSEHSLPLSAEKQRQLSALGYSELQLTDNADALVAACPVVIDFTTPENTLALARALTKVGGVHIIGTTGFNAAQQRTLEGYAGQVRMVQSGNFSLGVNVLECVVEQAAKALGAAYDVDIFEMHHNQKKDAPSGTALMLGKAAARGHSSDFEQVKNLAREGMTGARPNGEIGFATARGGDVVGIHRVMLAGSGEMLELSHQGFSRSIYATGALAAARWAKNQGAGLYSMKHVLGL